MLVRVHFNFSEYFVVFVGRYFYQIDLITTATASELILNQIDVSNDCTKICSISSTALIGVLVVPYQTIKEQSK